MDKARDCQCDSTEKHEPMNLVMNMEGTMMPYNNRLDRAIIFMSLAFESI